MRRLNCYKISFFSKKNLETIALPVVFKQSKIGNVDVISECVYHFRKAILRQKEKKSHHRIGGR